MEAGAAERKIHATFEARDATSPIAHAEYSVDAGPWQYLEPVGRVVGLAGRSGMTFVPAVPAKCGGDGVQKRGSMCWRCGCMTGMRMW